MGEGERKKKDVRIELVDTLDKHDHFVKFTPFLIAEISTHIADWYLLNKVIKSGYSYRMFTTQRKNHNLNDEEKEKIDNIIEKLTSKNFVDVVTIDEIKKPDLDVLFTLVSNQANFFDSIHVMTAKATGCEYFVTADKDLRNRTQPIISNGTILKNFKLASPSGFLKILKKQKIRNID